MKRHDTTQPTVKPAMTHCFFMDCKDPTKALIKSITAHRRSPLMRSWSSRAREGGDYYLLRSCRVACRLYDCALTSEAGTRIRNDQ